MISSDTLINLGKVLEILRNEKPYHTILVTSTNNDYVDIFEIDLVSISGQTSKASVYNYALEIYSPEEVARTVLDEMGF